MVLSSADYFLNILGLVSSRGLRGVDISYEILNSVNLVKLNSDLKYRIKAFVESPNHSVLVLFAGF